MAHKISPAAMSTPGGLPAADLAEVDRRLAAWDTAPYPAVVAGQGGVRVYPDGQYNKGSPMWWWWDCTHWVYYPQGGDRGGVFGEPPPALKTAAAGVARASGLLFRRTHRRGFRGSREDTR